MPAPQDVSKHYTHGNLTAAISAGVRSLGKTINSVSVDDHEFHIGGRQARRRTQLRCDGDLDRAIRGREIRLLDYIEGVGQPLAYYANELRRRGWKHAIICLPHDGVAHNNISGKRYIDHWVEAGFECASPIKNSGAGAAMMRIEAARRVFPRCWFNETTTEAGRDALGYYHERRDPNRNVGLGPEHDWSSNCCDSFGYMAISYPPVKSAAIRRPSPLRIGSHWSA